MKTRYYRRNFRGFPITFAWSGGIYIDVVYSHRTVDVINLRNYTDGTMRDPKRAVDAYMHNTNNIRDYLRNM